VNSWHLPRRDQPTHKLRRTLIPSKNECLLFLVVLVCYVYFFPRWADWNQNSRFDLVRAIVEQGTVRIDDYYQNTGDYAYYNGHYYSDKAPGTAFLGVVAYLPFWLVAHRPPVDGVIWRMAQTEALRATLNPMGTGLLSDKLLTAAGLTLVAFFVIAVPSVILSLLLYRFSGYLITSEVPRTLLVLAYALGTPAFAYSNNFSGHQLAAFLPFAAFYLAFRARFASWTIRRLVIVGLLLGYSLITEYPTLLIVGVVGLYILWTLPEKKRVIWLSLGAVLPLGLAAMYNYLAFGNPLLVGYEYSALWQVEHQTGFMSLVFPPRSEALWGITFSPFRGLFFYSPFLLLAIPGFLLLLRKREFRAEAVTCLTSVVVYFFFNSSSVMWWG
jgi:hypothetical protein